MVLPDDYGGKRFKEQDILTFWALLWIMIDELLGIIYYLWGGGGQPIYTVGNFPSVHFGSAF